MDVQPYIGMPAVVDETEHILLSPKESFKRLSQQINIRL
jgi:hypothetical protein